MQKADVIIIGGGQAGLAMSRVLQSRGIDYLMVERGEVAERWRSERWDSLRLLTPNWMTRLPGHRYEGPDQDGYMSRKEVVSFLSGYGETNNAPVLTRTKVHRVAPNSGGYEVATSSGIFTARSVVLATGYCDHAHVPKFANSIPDDVKQISPSDYKYPGSLAPGATVVVGASATGLQLADEINASGREVTICVGRHIRMPRSYLGHDIMHWLDCMGMLDQAWQEVPDIDKARRQPSLQLVGRPDARDLSLGDLSKSGVRIVGRSLDADRRGMRVSTDLSMTVSLAEHKLSGLLTRIDDFAQARGIDIGGGHRPVPLELTSPTQTIDFKTENIGNIIWATGFKRDYSWLHVPVLSDAGELVHQGGITPSPGLYALGLPFMRRRKSTFIDGVGGDAKDLAPFIEAHLNSATHRAA